MPVSSIQLSTVDGLLAVEETKELKARYFCAGDTKDEAHFRSVLTEDAILSFWGTSTDSIYVSNIANEALFRRRYDHERL